MRDTFIQRLHERAKSDDRIWLLTADLGYSVLEVFADDFPDRFVNVGVAEQNMIGIAAGLAMSGKKVFVYSIGNFPTFRCLEQLRNDVCYHAAEVAVVAVGGGFSYGAQGYTHHALEDIAVMRTLPGMNVYAPGDPLELTAAMDAVFESNGPAYIRLGRSGEPIIHDAQIETLDFPLTVGEFDGKDCLILTTGSILDEAIEAAILLRGRGIEVTLASMPRLKPICDDKINNFLRSFDKIVTVEEHSLIGGLRDVVGSVLLKSSHRVQLKSVAVGDGASIGKIGSQEFMRRECGLDKASIITAVELLHK